MDKNQILTTLFDPKKIRILRAIFNASPNELYLRELAKSARVSPASTHRIINKLLKAELIESRKIKNLILYKWKPNEFLESFIGDKKSAIQEFIDDVKQIKGVQEIILHGTEKKDKASIIVIGDLEAAALSPSIGRIKAKYDFSILSTVLPAAQYQQMSSMGLFPGQKKTLFIVT